MTTKYAYNRKNDNLYAFVKYREDIGQVVVSTLPENIYYDIFGKTNINVGYYELDKEDVIVGNNEIIQYAKKRIRKLRKKNKDMKKYLENPIEPAILKIRIIEIESKIGDLDRKIIKCELDDNEEKAIRKEIKEYERTINDLKKKQDLDTYKAFVEMATQNNIDKEIKLDMMIKFLIAENKKETPKLEEDIDNNIEIETKVMEETKKVAQKENDNMPIPEPVENNITIHLIKYVQDNGFKFELKGNPLTDKEVNSNIEIVSDGKRAMVVIANPCVTHDVDYDYEDNPIDNVIEDIEYIPITYSPFTGKKYRFVVDEIIDNKEDIEYWNSIVEKFKNRKRFHKGEREEFEECKTKLQDFVNKCIPIITL